MFITCASSVFAAAGLSIGPVLWYTERMRNRMDAKRKAQKNGTPMDAALHYLSARARTVREVERYLDERDYAEADVLATVNRLMELNLLNDLLYAEEFVRTRLATKPVSRRRLRGQLMQHEADPAAIDAALSAVPDDDEAARAAEVADKYARQMAALEPEERARRVRQRLLARGYDYDDIEDALNRCMAEGEEMP